MSRTREFNAGQGSVHHPNVDHYRDGGMGGIGPERSVVGMVPTHVLIGLRHHDGHPNGEDADDTKVIDSIRQDLRDGVGIREPVQIRYSHEDQWSYLGEGNHRLAAAVAEGIPEVPARVVRAPLAGWLKEDGVGMQTTHHLIPGTKPDYPVPSDFHPSYLKFGHTEDPQAPVHRREERGAADDTLAEIGRLLEPSWRQT